MNFAATIFQAGGLGSALGSPLIMMVVVMGIFYVMLILPQQRQRKKTQEMLGALKTGDKVVTNARHLRHHQRLRWRHRHPQNRRTGQNPHRAFGNFASGDHRRCEVDFLSMSAQISRATTPAHTELLTSSHESKLEVESNFHRFGHCRLHLRADRPADVPDLARADQR